MPWTVGDYEWLWVDNDASSAAKVAIAPWISLTFRTSELQRG